MSERRAPRGARANRQPLREIRSCLVVGTGLIGTSVALALRGQGVDVHLTDRDPQAVRRAADLGAGTAATATAAGRPGRRRGQPVGHRRGGDRPAGRQRAATVVDTASVKAGVLREVGGRRRRGAALRRHPPDGRPRAVRSGGGARRPLRGPAVGGRRRPAPTSARWPGPALLVARVRRRCAVEMDAAAHDAAVALVSHVPQVAASLVAARLAEGEDAALALTGQGLRDVTRVAATDPDLWVDVLAANAGAGRPPAHRAAPGRRRASCTPCTRSPRTPSGPGPSLREVLVRGNAGRARLPGKHGGRPTPYAVVPVVAPGPAGRAGPAVRRRRRRRGRTSRTSASSTRPGQPVGLVELAVAPGAEAGLVEALTRSAGSCTPRARSLPVPHRPCRGSRMPHRSRRRRTEHRPPARLVVAVDGPSGSGKSSVSREVARAARPALPGHRRDVPRADLVGARQGVDLDDAARSPGWRASCRWSSAPRPTPRTSPSTATTSRAAIRDPRISAAVSAVATNLGVRERARPAPARDRRRRAASSSRVATSPPSSRRTPTSGCCSPPTSRPGWPGARWRCTAPTTTTRSPRPATTWSAGTPQDSTVADFTRGRPTA